MKMKKNFGFIIILVTFLCVSCGKQKIEIEMIQIPNKQFEVLSTEVTQKLYESVMNQNPSKNIGENNPVTNISWCDAIYFCNKLSKINGLTPVYSVHGETDVSKWNYAAKEGLGGQVTKNDIANGYRLPTVDEWQYAAKGGQDYTYAGSNTIDEVAWYDENSNRISHSVSQKKANAYGLYDMSGNVSELCYDSANGTDDKLIYNLPGGVNKYHRKHCGGSFIYNRKIYNYDYINFLSSKDYIGFRIVRTITE